MAEKPALLDKILEILQKQDNPTQYKQRCNSFHQSYSIKLVLNCEKINCCLYYLSFLIPRGREGEGRYLKTYKFVLSSCTISRLNLKGPGFLVFKF